MRSNIIEIEVAITAVTERAVLVYLENPDKAVWLPLSQIEIEPNGGALIHTVMLPEWLALEKGLI